MAAPSSSEGSSQFPEETLIYLDDIEEFQSPMSRDGNCQDQRLFMFKSTVPPKVGDGGNEGYIEQYDPWIVKAGSRSSRKSGKASGKRLRTRSVSRAKQSMKDVGCVIYYSESNWSSRNQNRRYHHHRKHPKKIRIEESQQSYYAQKRLQQQPCYAGLRSNILPSKCRYDRMSSRCSCSCSFNCGVVTDCSLEHSCYFCTSDDREELEIPPLGKRGGSHLCGGYQNMISSKKNCRKSCLIADVLGM
ncbi:hypothetical protein L1049_024527 [Liquidambar formosana]|uniref:Uncharacterized protein n=1 Tax=Liquidambar formosana TaxID=63359 RepID=A0AAP0RV16_LIQFO